MFIRSRQDALGAVAEILDLPARRDQIVQSTVKVMLCLDAEQRVFMTDCQALLVEGGLESLRRRRHEAADLAELTPLVVIDLDRDPLYEIVASALDALQLTEVARQVFPDVQAERWQLALALVRDEAGIRQILTRAIRARGDAEAVAACRRELEERIGAHRPIWAPRAALIRQACLETLERSETSDPFTREEEAGEIFELFALADGLAMQLLAAIDSDPGEAAGQIAHLREIAADVRQARSGSAGDARQAA